jgi:hypothetical protein
MKTKQLTKQEARIEALRYIENGKEILREKARKENNFYRDPKYVKMAGNTFWNGVLVALDARFPEIRQGKGRPSQIKYREAINDGKASDLFDSTYEQLHLVMGYDGVGDARIVQMALKNANQLIDWATQ